MADTGTSAHTPATRPYVSHHPLIARLTPIQTADTPSTRRVRARRRAWGNAIHEPRSVATMTREFRSRFTEFYLVSSVWGFDLTKM
jgi:hypothetical protein